MARKPRIEFEGAFYHVIVRGNQRQKIFRDRNDYLKYLEILANYKNRYRFYLYSYVLMNNHIHLLLETQEIPISKIQQGINQSYTMYFNRRNKTVGHLFQGRYKAILCDRDEYLLSLVKYIHLNSVRAKAVETPDEYEWSSHHDYAGQRGKNNLIDTDQVLRMFSEDKATARKLYRAYMEDGISIKKEDIYRTIDQRVLGSEGFVDKITERYEVELAKERRKKEYTLSEIAKGIEKLTGVSLKNIREQSKAVNISLGRKVFCLVAKEYAYKGKEISEYIRKDPAVVSIAQKGRKQLEEDINDVIKYLKDMA
ncbi:MAG: transposase [Nitrospirae bacterium]|nr:transposase [Nitrospirota bacterium]